MGPLYLDPTVIYFSSFLIFAEKILAYKIKSALTPSSGFKGWVVGGREGGVSGMLSPTTNVIL